MREFIAKKGVEGLVKVIHAEDRFEGATNLLLHYGFGALKPNMGIIGDSLNEKGRDKFCGLIHRLYQIKNNLLIMHKGAAGVSFAVGLNSNEKKKI